MSLLILCSGQGSQSQTMFESIVDNPNAKSVLAAAESIFLEPVNEFIFNETNLYTNTIAQPLIITLILARWTALQTLLPESPKMILGYSVGELAAHGIAGSMSIESCISLSRTRAQLMDKAALPNSGMLSAQGLSLSQIENLCCKHSVSIAIINDDTHFVIGGNTLHLKHFKIDADSLGARTTYLKVTVPSHTHLLQSAAEKFADKLSDFKLSIPIISVLAGINGRMIYSTNDVVSALSKQIMQTIQWKLCMTNAVERGASVFLELGPGVALSKMVLELFPNCKARSLDEFSSIKAAASWVEQML